VVGHVGPWKFSSPYFRVRAGSVKGFFHYLYLPARPLLKVKRIFGLVQDSHVKMEIKDKFFINWFVIRWMKGRAKL